MTRAAFGDADDCFISNFFPIARGMTAVSVGSGVLFGETQTWKTSETKSGPSCEITRRIFTSLGLLGSMTAGLRDRKVRLFFSTSDTEPGHF